MLVATDGTVTRMLEAFTGEEIKVVKLDQSFGAVGQPGSHGRDSQGPERPVRAGNTGPERPVRAGNTAPERPVRADGLAEDAALESGAGATLIRRTILLRGKESLTNYVHARSVVMVDRVPVTMVYGMIYTNKPVGLLLAADRVETSREILSVGKEPAGAHGGFFDLDADAPMIVRTYRILVRGLPALLITERFPAACFVEPVPMAGRSRQEAEGVRGVGG
jgi:chorismate-pyruvate lyase